MSDRRWHVLLEQKLSDCMSKRYDMAIIADTADEAISGVLARAYAAAAFSPALAYTVLHVIDFPMVANRTPPVPSPPQKIEPIEWRVEMPCRREVVVKLNELIARVNDGPGAALNFNAGERGERLVPRTMTDV